MSPPYDDVTLCGWRVASRFPLSDLAPWTGEDRAVDLQIDLGPLPARLADPTFDAPLLQVSADGVCRFEVPGVAAYLIDAAGRHVVVDAALDPTAPEIQVFLLGTVLGILCYRRGLLPLHASCVRIGDGAVALAGTSGIGKSTLAAEMLRRGHEFLADDVTVLDVAAPGGPMVLPSFPRLKLWGDAMARLRLATEGLERTRPELDKYHLPVSEAFRAVPLPLRAVVHLEPAGTREAGIPRRLGGAEAAARVARDLYRAGMVARLGLSARVLHEAAAVVAVPGGTWLLPHGHADGELERGIAGLLAAMAP